jgi:hypothetical protein
MLSKNPEDPRTSNQRVRAPARTKKSNQFKPSRRKVEWPAATLLRPGMTWEEQKAEFRLGINDGGFIDQLFNPRLPDGIIDAIVHTAKVPPKFRSSIAKHVPMTVHSVMYYLEAEKWEWSGRSTQRQLEALVDLSKQLANAISSLSGAPLELLFDAMCILQGRARKEHEVSRAGWSQMANASAVDENSIEFDLEMSRKPREPVDENSLELVFDVEMGRKRSRKQGERLGPSGEHIVASSLILPPDPFGGLVHYRIPDPLTRVRRLLLSLADAASAARLEAEPTRRDPWRPKGSVKTSNLHLFVSRLYRDVIRVQGKLTASENIKTGQLQGTLPDVLDLLRPYLPGVIPERHELSRKTLERIIRKAKAEAKKYQQRKPSASA